MTILAFLEAEQETPLHASPFAHFTRIACSNLSKKTLLEVPLVPILSGASPSNWKKRKPKENPLRQKSAPRRHRDTFPPTNQRIASCSCAGALQLWPCFRDSQHAKQQKGVSVIKKECLPP